METLVAIRTRRSVRNFTGQPVPDSLIMGLLEAAMYAPSAGNEQPWHYVVIRERQALDAIPGFHPFAAMLPTAPVAVLVCGDPALEKYHGRWMLDCSAATQNILLAAHAQGLAAVWVGIYPEEARMTGMRRLLGIPESIIPLALIPVGYPAEQLPNPPHRMNETRIHYDRW